MRISDWSSDVCSSDLFAPERTATRGMLAHGLMVMDALGRMRPAVSRLTGSLLAPMDGEKGQPQEENADGTEVEDRGRDGSMDAIAHACRLPGDAPILLPEAKTLVGALRSEEHTSELQSLMRIS